MQPPKAINDSILGDDGSDPAVSEITKAFSGLAGDFSYLIEPLFNLPTKLPVNASGEHIPFLFVLIKLLCPNVYVELGVSNGASLIAASTAAKTYDYNMFLYGVDTWKCDDNADHCSENNNYEELKAYLETNFSNTKLMRCLNAEARERFSQQFVDLLYINDLHSYDSAKENFTIWLETMSSTGVIIFDGISFDEDEAGMRLFWSELKVQYTTLEFNHASGLGVVLLDPDDVNVAPLKALAIDNDAMRVYASLVSLIGDVLPERMGYFSAAEMLAWKDRLINVLYQSMSWKVTAPLRALKRIWSRNLHE